jgi:hypothetical protein
MFVESAIKLPTERCKGGIVNWVRHKYKKIAHVLKPKFSYEWAQMRCGVFFYPEFVITDNDAPKCKKCLKITKEKP